MMALQEGDQLSVDFGDDEWRKTVAGSSVDAAEYPIRAKHSDVCSESMAPSEDDDDRCSVELILEYAG